MPGGIDVMKQFYDLFIFYLYIFRSGKKISKTQTCKCKSYSSTFSERIYINYFKKKTILRKCFMYCRSFLFILLLFVVIFTLLELKSIKFCSPLLGECFVRQTMGEQISKNQKLYGQPVEPI